MVKDYKAAAARILNALENGTVPISWHEMHRKRLEDIIAQELRRMDKEGNCEDYEEGQETVLPG